MAETIVCGIINVSSGKAVLKKDVFQVIAQVYLCGRLAEFKYYNMDQVILGAFDVYDLIAGSVI